MLSLSRADAHLTSETMMVSVALQQDAGELSDFDGEARGCTARDGRVAADVRKRHTGAALAPES